jgi:hypothetical protein
MIIATLHLALSKLHVLGALPLATAPVELAPHIGARWSSRCATMPRSDMLRVLLMHVADGLITVLTHVKL